MAVDMQDLLIMLTALHSCDKCGALTLREDAVFHADWHRRTDPVEA